ncbi:TetR family transcriptional regulator [Peribacillus butanolivorans]|uniref:TetR/AcrR family transcriptional regulator n=1 Tax=Peribacillus butanolivorans TaxID=421767 RepID=UPI0006A6B049|nr:TetR/AcrR family transcriptional regulator [Peribacillus butanolivorans]KON67274.1 TetR family transcriptional regulator [Peribacillus butanolivorans]
MFSKFLSLDEEKQMRILNAAIKVYVERGYDNASTNAIVKEAGISKGLLFHYFQNKKTLYLFLFDYCLDMVMKEFYEKVNLEERDFFARLRQISLIKMELLNKFPDIIRFFEKAILEEANDIKGDFKEKIFSVKSSTAIFDDIDTSKFRDDIDIQKAIKSILWTFEGFSNEVLTKAKALNLKKTDYEEVFSEGEQYIEMFKRSFYK